MKFKDYLNGYLKNDELKNDKNDDKDNSNNKEDKKDDNK